VRVRVSGRPVGRLLPIILINFVLILSNPLLHVLLWTLNVIMLPSVEVKRGGMGPPGAESVWSWVPLSLGRPLNLVLYIPFRTFAYSFKYFKG